MDHPTLWDRATSALSKLPDLLAKIGPAVLAVIGIWGMLRGLPKLLNHGAVVKELLDEREERKRAERGARDYREAAEIASRTAQTYKELYEATHAELGEVRSEMAQERLAREEERQERVILREQVTSAFLYLVDVIAHFKANGLFSKMPPIPDNLQEGIAAAMADRARKLREAPNAEPPFPQAPSTEGG